IRAVPDGPLDVNRADSAALDALPGVGPALARRIVVDRAARGPYASMAELSRVPGIGAGMERRLAGAVRFGGVTFPPGGRPLSGSVPAAAAGWPPP
ncbi:MAG TPA: helix-hairpin-helix domain-containing protein, partial [Gemmatirosa sp.]